MNERTARVRLADRSAPAGLLTWVQPTTGAFPKRASVAFAACVPLTALGTLRNSPSRRHRIPDSPASGLLHGHRSTKNPAEAGWMHFIRNDEASRYSDARPAVFADTNNLQRIGAARRADRFTDGQHDQVAFFYDAGFHQQLLSVIEQLITVGVRLLHQ